MIELGVTDFYLDVASLPREEFERHGTDLFDSWDRFLAMELRLPDFGVRLELEEGSIRGRGRIVAAAAMVWAGVISYGGFVEGVQAINATIRTSGRVLVDSAAEAFPIPELLKRFRRAPGFPGRLERPFAGVKSGELTPA